MPPSSLRDLFTPLSIEKRIIIALQYMLRSNDHAAWWLDFPHTPVPDIVSDRSTRMLFYSFEKFERHRDRYHAAFSTEVDDTSDSDQDNREDVETFYEPSDWEGQDGNGCASCEHFKDIWIMEEWVFGAASLMFDGESSVTDENIVLRILAHRGELTLEEWIQEKLVAEEEREEGDLDSV